MKFKGRIAVFGGRDITESIYNDTVEVGKRMSSENWLVFCGGGEGDIPKSISTNSVDSLITEVKNCLNQ